MRREKSMYIRCVVYVPTDSTSISVVDICYERLKEDVYAYFWSERK